MLHTPHVQPATTTLPLQPLQHLWLELTRKCNLNCVHCYVSANPHLPLYERLATVDWLSLLDEAFSRGCRSVQFIGGEPLLHPDLETLMRHARAIGFEHIEVFSNATRLTKRWVELFSELDILVALSFYATTAEGHDDVTNTRGSFLKTLRAIDLAVDAKLRLRVGVIQVNQSDAEIEATKSLLAAHGVLDVGFDRVRSVGRADAQESFTSRSDQISQLCGACSEGKLCVTASGEVFPCIMARSWLLGDATDGLGTILDSPTLAEFRHEQQQFLATEWQAACSPDKCGPYCKPTCNPYKGCSPKCGPSCNPPCGPLCFP